MLSRLPLSTDLLRTARRVAAAAAIVAPLAACSDTLGPRGARPMSLSFTTSRPAGSAVAGLSRDVRVGSGGDTLVITSVELAFTKIELTKVGATCADTSISGSDDCMEIKATPTLVNLPLDGTVGQPITFAAPPGTYSFIEAKIRPIDPDKATRPYFAQFLAANPDFRDVTVRVRGTWRGEAFTYAYPVDADIEMSLGNVTVGDSASTGINLTVSVDVASWFRSVSGGLIDPRTANPGGVNAEWVSERIERSFKAFDDDDRDGSDDDGTPDQGPGDR